MARRACAFKETDVKRALRAVTAAGLIAISVVIAPDGTIKVDVAAKDNATTGANSWADVE
jgi:hypothetical protein